MALDPNQQKNFLALLNHRRARPTRRLVILGVSGSVGQTALNFISNRPETELWAASVHSSVDRLRALFASHPLRYAAITSERAYDTEIDSLKQDYPEVRFFRGQEGMVEMIGESRQSGADTVLTAVVGSCGIRATMAALSLGMKVALANKETLVTAGPAISHQIRKMAEEGRELPVILPVDSEHNAVFQLVEGSDPAHLDQVILTASGGPFVDRSREELTRVTPREVLSHPTWSMGPKITVDSAGLINKGLEIIEAHHLFSIPYDALHVYIHRKSLVHAMIRNRDGGYLLSASHPNMVFPVAHSLFYPDPVPQIHDVATTPDRWPSLNFEEVDLNKFPGFGLCLRAGKSGGTGPALLNGANEVAVELFLKGNIGFTDIPSLIELVLDHAEVETGVEAELFLEADRKGRDLAHSFSSHFAR